MTDESVDCFNCGRSNPEWAQVCRSCGVALRHGEARIVPTGRFPTDRDSLISMGAVIGTILAAVIVGLFLSSLNSTDPTVGEATPTPSPTPLPTPPPASIAPSVERDRGSDTDPGAAPGDCRLRHGARWQQRGRQPGRHLHARHDLRALDHLDPAVRGGDDRRGDRTAQRGWHRRRADRGASGESTPRRSGGHDGRLRGG